METNQNNQLLVMIIKTWSFKAYNIDTGNKFQV